MQEHFILTNFLPDEKRKKLIEDCKPFLRQLAPNGKKNYPSYQSDDDLRLWPQFHEIHFMGDILAQEYLQKKLIPEKSWFIMTQGKEDQYSKHNHPVDYVGVYYMNSHPSFTNGTEFEEYGFVEAPENSMLLFPGHLYHSPPRFEKDCSEYFERYTMSLNWIVKKD